MQHSLFCDGLFAHERLLSAYVYTYECDNVAFPFS